MATEQIYRIMPQLIEKGFVEKIINTPLKFQTIPVKTAINSMLISKEKNLTEIKKKATLLLEELEIKNQTLNLEESNLVLIPTGNRLEEFRFHWKQKLCETYDLITTSHRFVTGMNVPGKDFGVKETVKTRILLEEEPRLHKTVQEIISKMKKKLDIEYKFCRSPVLSAVAIGDRKEVVISLQTKCSYHQSPVYWTNNPGIVDIMNTHFEELFCVSSG